MNEQVEKIKREIEKWQEHAIRGMKKGSTAYHQGKLALCIDLLDFINSLPDADRPILTAEDVREVFNRVKTCAAKWSAIEGAYTEVAEWWNNGKPQMDYSLPLGPYENGCQPSGREDKHYYSWLDLEERQND